jgi:hypothetical protein
MEEEQMQPTTILTYRDGCPCADDVAGDESLLTFTSNELAQQYAQLGRQRAELVAVTVGIEAIREIVRATPGIKMVAIVSGLGPLVPVAGGKKGREATKVYLKRHAFLSLYGE